MELTDKNTEISIHNTPEPRPQNMKRTLLPLFAAAFLFACGTPAENATDTNKDGTTMGNDGEMPAHTEGDGHDHADDAAHEHSEGDGHDHGDAAHDTTDGHSHDDGHTH